MLISLYLGHPGVNQRSDLRRGKVCHDEENLSPLTCPQPYLAGVGKVLSFFSFADLFLFFKAFAAAAATGIEDVLSKDYRNNSKV